MKHPEKVTTLAVCHTAITSWIGDVENNQRCSFVLAEVVVVRLDHFRQLGSVSPLKVEVRKKCKRAVVVDTNTSVPSLRRHLKLHGGEKCWSLTIGQACSLPTVWILQTGRLSPLPFLLGSPCWSLLGTQETLANWQTSKQTVFPLRWHQPLPNCATAQNCTDSEPPPNMRRTPSPPRNTRQTPPHPHLII